MSPFEELCRHTRETSLLNSIEALLGWDERTQLPPAAADYRAEQMTYLSGLIHRRQTDPRVGEWLAALASNGAVQDPQGDTAVVVRQLQRQYDRKTKLPLSLVEEMTRTSVLGQQAWVEARKNNDFASFRPWLEKTFELKRQQAEALGYTQCRYDALLDEYEPGELTANITQVLAGLRDELIPLVDAIRSCDRKPDVAILKRAYPLAAQQELGRRAAERIGFEFQRGRLDVTAHPFCTEAGPHDCRITTRFDERFFPSAFFGILHEAGHGIYEQGLPTDQYGLPLGQYVSMGIHESQSRLWENLVGRSRSFWQHLYPDAQRLFPAALANVSLDDFHFAVNDVRPSIIRVEADEVTYNLHIIIRFELEQALLSGDLPVADLPAAWNAKYQQYLGITPANDAEGVLQDIHWSAGLVGYFPTYSLGNLYAAQFFAKADADLGGLNEQFARGDFQSLRQWLRDNIHSQGQRYTAAELAQRITGRPLGHKDLIEYLLAKMEPLYSGPVSTPVADAPGSPTESTSMSPAGEGAAVVATMPAGTEVGTIAENAISATTEGSTSQGEIAPAESDASAKESETSDVATLAVAAMALAARGESTGDPVATKDDDDESALSGDAAATETLTDVEAALPWSPKAAAPGDDAQFDPATLRTSPAPPEYKVGVIGNLIGMVLFGVAGLAIGYWLLNFFGGEQFNYFDVWLPFVKRPQESSLLLLTSDLRILQL